MTRAPLAVLLLLSACINEDTTIYEVRLSGNVAVGGSIAEPGAVHLQLHHASRGAGDLKTPLGFIEATERLELGPTTWTTFVPLDDGDGLVLYGWLDRDGDGILCAPGALPEPAGLVELQGFPAHSLDFSLDLSTDCAGPSALFPPP